MASSEFALYLRVLLGPETSFHLVSETALLIMCAQCGLYRTGTLWAHSAWPVDCHPDIVTMAKPLANGYPIGAVLMRDAVTETMTPGTMNVVPTVG